MKKTKIQALISRIRNKTPLSIRQRIGPILAKVYYIKRLYLENKNNHPRILSIDETIDLVLKNQLSVIRFGDGEIALIDGTDLAFQKSNKRLVQELSEVMHFRDGKLLLCIPGMWGNLRIFAPFAYHFIMHHMYRHIHIWNSLIDLSYVYGDTNMTRHYLAYTDKAKAGERFKKIFSLWKGKDVVLVEGEKSRLGVGNDMFNEVKSLERVLCPPENAYLVRDAIEEFIMTYSKDKLILLSLGPAAKVIALKLFKMGYRVLDIGHIDMEYEMYLRKYLIQTKVENKYFNEINARNPIDCKDEKYLNQVKKVIHHHENN